MRWSFVSAPDPRHLRVAATAAEVIVGPESPNRDDIRDLMRDSRNYYAALYPPESNHALDLESLAGPTVEFLAARCGGRLVGVGAMVVRESLIGEIKSMYVCEQMRGQGIGRLIIQALEASARRRGIACLRLETGLNQPEALALYETSGYRRIGPFGAYRDDRYSVFMEKHLANPLTADAKSRSYRWHSASTR